MMIDFKRIQKRLKTHPDATFFCPVTGLKAYTRTEWIGIQLSETFVGNFWIVGDSVLYSMPGGRADVEGVQNSLVLKEQISNHFIHKSGHYIQIQDYSALNGSSRAARSLFISNANEDNRLLAMIFCNLAPHLAIAVKIGNRFNTTGKIIHITKHYSEAINLANEFIEPPPPLEIYGSSLKECFKNRSHSLSPFEVIADNTWCIETSNFSSRSMIIDQEILYTTTRGFLDQQNVESLDRIRHLCRNAIPEDRNINYIIVDSSLLNGSNHQARMNYMKSMKNWHLNHPFKLYITHSANVFVRTAFRIARPIMPFHIKIAKDFTSAFSLIRDDRSGVVQNKDNQNLNDKAQGITHKDIETLMAVFGNINWQEEGIGNDFGIKANHPFYFLYQSIKLIKEEFDDLFNEREQAEEQIKASLKEKETLLHEVHHRVKNNMQVINSLLKLQSNTIDDDHIKEILKDSQSRVYAMSAVHETLHGSDKLSEINLKTYLSRVTNSVFQTYSINHGKVKLNSDVEDSPISLNYAYPLGLIINELISNSLKYAFPEDRPGEITVSTKKTDTEIELVVMDDGVGIPEELDWKNAKSLGLKLVRTLVENQLDGSMDMQRKNGTKFTIKLNIA